MKEPYEILVVNDGSTDNTLSILKKLKNRYPTLRVVSHKKNKGLGMALYTGFQHAKGSIIVTTDADLTHPPEMIGKLVDKIRQGFDFCVGSRYVRGGGMINVPFWRILLSKFSNLFFQLIFGCAVRDMTSGLRAYKSECIKKIRVEDSSFAVQLEIIVKILKLKAKMTEIPFVLKNRELGTSKFDFLKMGPVYFFNTLRLFIHRWKN